MPVKILESILAPTGGGAHALVCGLALQRRSHHEVEILARDPALTGISAERSSELSALGVSRHGA